jgi:hypothetical protein
LNAFSQILLESGRGKAAGELEPTETMRVATGGDHRRQPVVQTGAATSLGRKTDLPRKAIALTCEVGGFARLNHVLTHVVTANARTIINSYDVSSRLIVSVSS